MRQRTVSGWIVGTSLILAAVAGCGKSPPPQTDVSGTVTFEGKPVEGVIVTFYPIVEKGQPRLAYSRATSDAAGKYTLISEDGKPGAVVAKHKVVVNWPVRGAKEMATQAAPSPAIPTQYTTATETPIEVEVKSGQNDIPIDVKR
jgi:hypothetical protein